MQLRNHPCDQVPWEWSINLKFLRAVIVEKDRNKIVSLSDAWRSQEKKADQDGAEHPGIVSLVAKGTEELFYS
jgi:hypothetical protein